MGLAICILLFKSKYMKYSYFLFFSSLISCSAFCKPLDLSQTYTVCGHSIYPPISWTEGGEVKGIGPYLVSKVFSQFGIKVSFQQDSNWQRCLRELERGDIDIAAALYKTEHREKYYQFLSTPIIKEPIVLFYNKNYPQKFTTRTDLKGKTMGVLFGDLFGDEADLWIKDNMHVEYVSTGEQNFGKLVRGRIDIMPLGKYGGELQSKKLGYEKFITQGDRMSV